MVVKIKAYLTLKWNAYYSNTLLGGIYFMGVVYFDFMVVKMPVIGEGVRVGALPDPTLPNFLGISSKHSICNMYTWNGFSFFTEKILPSSLHHVIRQRTEKDARGVYSHCWIMWYFQKKFCRFSHLFLKYKVLWWERKLIFCGDFRVWAVWYSHNLVFGQNVASKADTLRDMRAGQNAIKSVHSK